jgi:hypothetical protein
MKEQDQNIFRKLRPLRIVLLLCVLVVMILRPEVGTPVAYEGIEIVNSLLAPVLAPIFFMLLLLDALMSRVWMSEAEGAEWDRLRLIVRIDLVMAVLLLIVWVPFFMAITE